MVEDDSLLPQELSNLIIEETRGRNHLLCQLCLVSKKFLPEARKCLYEDITISSSFQRSIELHDALTVLNPDLARLVCSLNHSFDASNPGEHYWNLMNIAFRNMVNLKFLSVSFSGSCGMPSMTTLYPWVQIPTRRISLEGTRVRLMDREYLQGHHEIRHLAISVPKWDKEDISSTPCPWLQALDSDGRIIELFLRGQSTITKLFWEPGRYDSFYVPSDKYAAKLASVQILSLGGCYSRPALGLLTPYLARLEVLYLLGWASHTVGLMAELEEIPSLQKLRKFVWSPGRFDRKIELTAQETQRGLVERWFRAMPALRSACFAMNCTDSTYSIYYLLWKRGEVEPVVIDWVRIEGRGWRQWGTGN
ncbi:hypothetical protein P691DRAFT_782856 [Macrolepiota fuliginosa MF-IS2]|uniref:Uncharacterized protein n=1 Tax=Macrolepiota fuliginosa MF-IS2 TaxID=1400762 RepID=A0A9P5XCM7_9AGAR|nr:hypothetical protein P691DRAFT_782856 [Macrolepiota fuliginosa MF-IS2]